MNSKINQGRKRYRVFAEIKSNVFSLKKREEVWALNKEDAKKEGFKKIFALNACTEESIRIVNVQLLENKENLVKVS